MSQNWVETVDRVTKNHPYSNSRLRIAETVDGIYRAFEHKVSRMKRYLSLAETMM